MASALEWVPETLYNMAVSAIVEQYSRHRVELRMLPENVQFDVYFQLYNKGRLCLLAIEFSDLYIFSRVLKVHERRHLLHHAFQALMDHSHDGQVVSNTLASEYRNHIISVRNRDERTVDKAIQLGFSLGCFLDDAGWSESSESVFLACADLCRRYDNATYWAMAYECAVRLIHVRTCYCKYDLAEESYETAWRLAERLEQSGRTVNKAMLYTERCSLLYSKSLYDEAYRYCCMALREVSDRMPKKNIVDVFRQCGKVCVVKRQFRQAELLIKHAVEFTREHFGWKHHKYSDALVDYGFYLLNVDSVNEAVKVYQTALDIRQSVFGGNNLHVANAHEDLAYASYVQAYSSGKLFSHAKSHAERAIEIISKILPSDHLLTASSKRVKALILEEIAIDSNDKYLEDKLLHESQDLHLASLALAQRAFGESNVQTAKHYGNLGRLYQSMRYYKQAQDMHLKAIEIKERLLGPDDYEVALSVGHLASLYNYDMQMYSEAERLYFRSIDIAKKWFGPGYSGLEYDYLGLCQLYRRTGDTEQANRYGSVLREWAQIRSQDNNQDSKPLDFVGAPRDLRRVVDDFLCTDASDSRRTGTNLCSNNNSDEPNCFSTGN